MAVLAACDNNSPQQPSDVVDDRSSQSPYGSEAGTETEGTETAALDDSELAAVPTVETGDPEVDELFTGTPGESPEISPIAGTWAVDSADCEVGGGSSITMTADRFERVGQSCEIVSTVGSGQGSIAVTLNCPGSGGTGSSEIVKLAPQEDGGMLMNVVGTQEAPQVLQRCQ